jgi:hypothetical protein
MWNILNIRQYSGLRVDTWVAEVHYLAGNRIT